MHICEVFFLHSLYQYNQNQFKKRQRYPNYIFNRKKLIYFCKSNFFIKVVKAKLTKPWEGGGFGGKNP